MKLSRLSVRNYRSLRDESIDLNALNVFIGANASGKSTILDALRFLHEGIQARDFRTPVFARGGIVHLAWKGEAADWIELVVRLEEGVRTFEWSLRLVRDGYEFHVEERVDELPRGSPPTHLLESSRGGGWWWSGEKGERVELKQGPNVLRPGGSRGGCVVPGPRHRGVCPPVGVLRPESLPAPPRLGQSGFGPVRPLRPKSGRDALHAAQIVAGSAGGDCCRDAGGRRFAVEYRATGIRGPLLLRTVRAWT